MGKTIKISYDQELKGSLLSKEGKSNDSKKEIKSDHSMDR